MLDAVDIGQKNAIMPRARQGWKWGSEWVMGEVGCFLRCGRKIPSKARFWLEACSTNGHSRIPCFLSFDRKFLLFEMQAARWGQGQLREWEVGLCLWAAAAGFLWQGLLCWIVMTVNCKWQGSFWMDLCRIHFDQAKVNELVSLVGGLDKVKLCLVHGRKWLKWLTKLP